MAEKTIYNLELHEIFNINACTFIRRVPGGWIYYSQVLKNRGDRVVDASENSVFVPFSNEFTPPNIAARTLLKRAEEKRQAQEQTMKNPAEGTD